ncbi:MULTISPECIES: cobalt-factor II C(20)-methyltransferase [unclassified Granulicatella]|uniref:cobalt-factor II C(20)-methyltransferase n=1 Tax=unclassified Granulicatella TaxID=2630493 RepID=UPI0010733B45|nr:MULTISPECIES: cobalt-factor II C(20)-methyltransferase [unclassified Granulicatella]MBF0779522.1 cobalt-factor II C(20)-methyltransferase [Granulicatella sp. 19428wC4_WM01]TFU96487.1 cobalt-factor II C(20)-methyltransferase [Granulicatella sp. WM01]
MAKFYGIGIGPGDSELVTVKASRLLSELDILYTPEAKMGGKSLALKIADPYIKEDLEIKQRHFPMVRDRSLKEGQWKEIADEIVQDVKSGKNVGFITLGDPMVYSTYSYLLEIIGDSIETQTIPGITSFNSIASQVNIPLVMDEESFAIVPATSGAEKLEEALKLHETVVIMKVANHLAMVLPLLEKYNLLHSTVLVSHASMDKQTIRRDISDLSVDEKLTYFTTMIVKKG